MFIQAAIRSTAGEVPRRRMATDGVARESRRRHASASSARRVGGIGEVSRSGSAEMLTKGKRPTQLSQQRGRFSTTFT